MTKIIKNGFTLIELMVVTVLIVMMTTLVLANYRQGEKSRKVGLTVDAIVSALTAAQNNALTGKATSNSTGACRVPQSYYVTFNYTTQYSMYALNNCGGTDLIENFTLPQGVRIKESGLIAESSAVGANLSVSFIPPYGNLKIARDSGSFNPFQTASIIIETVEGSISQTVTIDGISGRIGP
jgi:prepilin-type N-terminal cleavage/methylation domain-containing protein